MRNYWLLLLLVLPLNAHVLLAQRAGTPSFQVVPLGVKGGLDESNLSAYMLAPANSNNYICLDAGTLRTGIRQAVTNKVFRATTDEVLKKYIKGYLISHAHLDHLAGLIINSTDDSTKIIYALPDCIEQIQKNYFNWQSWPNFGNTGAGLALKKYAYKPLNANGAETAIQNTDLQVQAFPLSHGDAYQSAAFLIRNKEDYVLYLGDTGPDAVEKKQNLQNIWQKISPLVKANKLKGIFIEVSYPDEQPDKLLFGHLTPHWLMREMETLHSFTGKGNLNSLNVIITHIKPADKDEEKVKAQLKAQNKLKLNLIFPEQGKAFSL